MSALIQYAIADALLFLGILLMASGALFGLRIATRHSDAGYAAEARYRDAVRRAHGIDGVARADEVLWGDEVADHTRDRTL